MKGHQHNEKYKVGLCSSLWSFSLSAIILLTLSYIFRARKSHQHFKFCIITRKFSILVRDADLIESFMSLRKMTRDFY